MRQLDVIKIVLRFSCTINGEQMVHHHKAIPSRLFTGGANENSVIIPLPLCKVKVVEREVMVSIHHLLREERISDAGRRINGKYTGNWPQEDTVSKDTVQFHRYYVTFYF